jgi:hypothetical protein
MRFNIDPEKNRIIKIDAMSSNLRASLTGGPKTSRIAQSSSAQSERLLLDRSDHLKHPLQQWSGLKISAKRQDIQCIERNMSALLPTAANAACLTSA